MIWGNEDEMNQRGGFWKERRKGGKMSAITPPCLNS